MKEKFCEICGDPIGVLGIRFVKAKLVCKACFEIHKSSKRLPRSFSVKNIRFK